ncbi:hypothetical protein O181_033416 [Austropuccinia psidii MF-1]|uniref:Uncharacterized protein n=1 Tax=Austropuccinia psidii MF-1 TaxID=1389203 RepID=A0A9Q3D4D9_9BASI|nr:hypothetical protein [Austropuccinia psidii MF-1]
MFGCKLEWTEDIRLHKKEDWHINDLFAYQDGNSINETEEGIGIGYIAAYGSFRYLGHSTWLLLKFEPVKFSAWDLSGWIRSQLARIPSPDIPDRHRPRPRQRQAARSGSILGCRLNLEHGAAMDKLLALMACSGLGNAPEQQSIEALAIFNPQLNRTACPKGHLQPEEAPWRMRGGRIQPWIFVNHPWVVAKDRIQSETPGLPSGRQLESSRWTHPIFSHP